MQTKCLVIFWIEIKQGLAVNRSGDVIDSYELKRGKKRMKERKKRRKERGKIRGERGYVMNGPPLCPLVDVKTAIEER